MMTNDLKAKAGAVAKIPEPLNMVNRPTVVPTTGVENPGMQVLRTDPYFSLEVDTTGLTERQEIVLFDGSRGYQLGMGVAMPLGAQIVGRSAPYQFILNDIVHNASFVDTVRLQVYAPNGGGDDNNCCNSNDIAMLQFSNAVDVYDSSKGGRPRRVGNFYPDMGIHEGQFQLNISTFKYPITITNRTALVYIQEPGIRVVWSFYQKAELGRKQ